MNDPQPDLTLVLERETREITGGRYDDRAALGAWIRQADALAPRRCEILVASPRPEPDVEALSSARTAVRNVVAPGASYYALKNAGSNAARGRVVFFSDSDCRPGEGTLAAVLDAFEEEDVECVAGVTFYDGTGWMTRLNTTTSFGYLHQGEPTLEGRCALSHNVAVRRSSYERDVFGPYRGRVGGDIHMTDAYRARGPVRIEPRMVILHEDPTWSLRGLLDRHLREIFDATRPLHHTGDAPALLPLVRDALRAAWRRPRRQRRLVRRYGPALGITPRQMPAVRAVFAAHALLDSAATLAILAAPPLRRRWLSYHFGGGERDAGAAHPAG